MFNRIRRYSLRDKESIRNLCMANCDIKDKTEDNLSAVLLMYCNYYLDREQNYCFVAVDEKDEVVGYILCAPDFDKYQEAFNKDYRPNAILFGIENYVAAGMNMIPYSMFKDKCPAHFHIDISSDYQRQGIGTKLLNVLRKELDSADIPGMMCVCSDDNKAACSFYQKYGFKQNIATKLGISYTMEFSDNE